LARLLAAQAGHHHVEHDAVDVVGREGHDGLLARRGGEDVVAFLLEELADPVAKGEGVVDGEDDGAPAHRTTCSAVKRAARTRAGAISASGSPRVAAPSATAACGIP